jgi:hemoglobin
LEPVMSNRGIDEDGIRRLVELFYSRAREDEMLGPVFNDAVHDWPEHFDKLAAFWSSITLTTGRYKGNPMIAHLKHVRRVTPAMFDRWLALWHEATAEAMPTAAAEEFRIKAARIAESLKLALFYRVPGAPDFAARPG